MKEETKPTYTLPDGYLVLNILPETWEGFVYIIGENLTTKKVSCFAFRESVNQIVLETPIDYYRP